MPVVLGFDPGSTGGASLVSADAPDGEISVLGAMRWGPAPGGWELQWLERRIPRRAVVSSLAMVGVAVATVLIPLGLPDAMLREEQYIGPDPGQAIRIARNSGQVEGALVASVRPWRDRPPIVRGLLPPAWRNALGLPHCKERDEAKEVSLSQIPPLVMGLREILEALGQWDDLAESSGMGVVGIRHRCWEDSEDEFLIRVESSTGPIRSKKGARRVARVRKRRTR